MDFTVIGKSSEKIKAAFDKNYWFHVSFSGCLSPFAHVHDSFAPCTLTYLQMSILERPGMKKTDHELSTYPSAKATFCPKWEVSVNVGLREG